MADRKSDRKQSDSVKPIRIAAALAIAAASFFLGVPLGQQAQLVLAITLFTGALWFLEAIPLYLAGVLSTLLLIIFASVSPSSAFQQYSSPTIVLFFGGFVLARAMQRHGLDRQMAVSILSRFGREPKNFLLGLMLITAFLSMWISNTAATAIMLPIALFVLERSGLKPLQSPYGRATVLGIAYAATIGGIGTIVGTPPNGIAVANLAEHGITITFLEWMWYAVPLAALALPVSWLVLITVFRPEVKTLMLDHRNSQWTGEQKNVLAVGALTVALWVTSFLHGIPDSAVALLPLVLLSLAGLFGRDDLSKIDWSVLLLFGAGLTLGAAIDSSGLSAYLGSQFSGLVAGQTVMMVYLAVIGLVVLLTMVGSNTATAAIAVPVMMGLSGTAGAGLKQLGLVAGMGTSLDFIMPLGTPPSAIAYSSGYVRMGDMIRAGLLITILCAVLLAALAVLFW